MKTKSRILGIIAIVAVAAIACYNVLTSQKDVKLSDLALANAEALAQSEQGRGRVTCYNSISGLQGDPNLQDKTWCNGCTFKPASSWSDPSECGN